MRTVSAGLSAWLDTHTAGVIRHLVTITPRVGPVAYWTDHATDIVIGGHTFLAGGTGTVPIVSFGKRVEAAGTKIGSLEIRLGCGTSATFGGMRLPKAAADRAFDGAVVKVERLFGETDVDTSLGAMHLFEGIVAEARPSSASVDLEIESGLAALNVEVPAKLFKAGCHNLLFDAQCGLVKATYTVTGTAAAGSTASVVNSGRTEADGYYDLGVITFDAGTSTVALRGASRAVRSYAHASGAFTLDRPLPVAPSTSDTFTAFPGCPKTLLACQSKFATDQRARFRGFPNAPRDAIAGQRGVKGSQPIYGTPVPIVYGTQRVGSKSILWTMVGDPATTISYYFDESRALCEGPIDGVSTRYTANEATPIASVSPPVTVRTGTRPTQTAIGASTLTYPGIAIAASALWSEAEPEWEVRGKLYGTSGTYDADPADVIHDLLSNGGPQADPDDGYYGAAFPFEVVTDSGLGATGSPAYWANSSYRRYCAENGFGISLALTEATKAIDVLADICKATNAEPLWSEGKLKIVPCADTAIDTFIPVDSVRYGFDESHLIASGDEDPVSVRIQPETESFNVCPVTFRERAPEGAPDDGTLAYQEATEDDPDPVDVLLRGERRADPVSLPMITNRDHALKLSRILAQRQVRTRQEVEFRVAFPFCRLEPLDLITLSDALFPYSAQPFQIREISEGPDHVLTITAQEWTTGVNHATAHTTQSSDGPAAQWPAGNTEDALQQVIYQGDNRWPNPNSEVIPTSSSAWGPAWSGRYEAGSLAYTGTWVRQVMANETGEQTLNSPMIACIPGNTFKISAMARKGDSGFPYSCWVRLEAFAPDQKTVVSTSDSASTQTTTWARVSTTLIIPGSASFVRASLVAQGIASGDGPHWFDAIDFTRSAVDPTTLTASLTPASVSGSCERASAGQTCTATTGTCTASGSGGVPPYTYAWSRVSGDSSTTANAATSAATTFSRTAAVPNSYTSVWKCTVTDFNGTTADTSSNVTVSTDHIQTG